MIAGNRLLKGSLYLLDKMVKGLREFSPPTILNVIVKLHWLALLKVGKYFQGKLSRAIASPGHCEAFLDCFNLTNSYGAQFKHPRRNQKV